MRVKCANCGTIYEVQGSSMEMRSDLQRQITATELGNSINEFAGQTDWDTDPMKIAKNIILKYKVLSK